MAIVVVDFVFGGWNVVEFARSLMCHTGAVRAVASCREPGRFDPFVSCGQALTQLLVGVDEDVRCTLVVQFSMLFDGIIGRMIEWMRLTPY